MTQAILEGMRVETYYNLHKQCLSYRPIGGRVRHAQALVLNDVTFAVQPAGRERVRREGRKNVHAFVRGTLAWISDDYYRSMDDYTDENMCRQGYRKLTYNPYKHDGFVMADIGIPSIVKSATQVVIIGKNIYLSGEVTEYDGS